MISTARSLTLLMVALLAPACERAGSGTAEAAAGLVPVTTASEEALTVFEEGRLLQANLRGTEARERFDRAIALDPAFALAYAYRATTSPPAEVERFIQRAIEYQANASEAERLEIQAIKHSVDGNAAAEVEVLRALLESHPDDYYVLSRLGTIQYFARDYEGAAESFRRVVELAPDFGPVYNMLGYTYRELGDEDAAEQAFLDYIRTSPDEPNPYDSLGELYLDQGRYAEAREQWEQAVARDPTFTVSRINIGNAYLLEGDYDAARRQYEMAASGSDPADQVNGRRHIADSYLHQGDDASALRVLREAEGIARENARYPLVEQTLGSQYLVHWMHDRIDEAEVVRGRLVELSRDPALPPGSRAGIPATAAFLAGMTAVKRGDAAAATAAIDEATRILEEGGSSYTPIVRHNGLGMAAMAARDYQGAIGHLEQSDTADPLVQYHLGLAHEALGHPDVAATHFRNVAESREIVNFSTALALTRPLALAKLGQ